MKRSLLTLGPQRPHNGRNITAPDFGKAIHDALNFDITAGEDQANLQLQALGRTVVDLEDLNAHEIVEHRASLTRNDASSGDSIHIDLSRLRAMLADSTTDYINVNSLAKSRVRVEALSSPLTTGQVQQSAGEGGLLLMAMSTVEIPTNGSTDFSNIIAPKDRVNAWFTNERLPVEFGWKPAPRQYKFADVGGLTGAILTLREADLAQKI